MKRFLQRIGILRTPDMRSETYEFYVFLMSGGTAQGLPRPMEVKSFKKTFTWDAGARMFYDGKACSDDAVRRCIKYGLDIDMANGKSVRYAPKTIYKITKEKVRTND